MRIPGSVADTPPATGARESTLSADLNVTGTISGQDLDVLGHFEGELRLAGQLRMGAASRVKAIVKAKAVEIEGEFEGEVRAESLRLAPTARARGIFVAKRLVIEGFLAALVERFEEGPVRETLAGALEGRLAAILGEE